MVENQTIFSQIPNVNAIIKLKIELVYFEDPVKYVSHYATGIHLIVKGLW